MGSKEAEFNLFLFYISSDNTYYVTQTERGEKKVDFGMGFIRAITRQT